MKNSDSRYIVRMGRAEDRRSIRSLMKAMKDSVNASLENRQITKDLHDKFSWIVAEEVKSKTMVAAGAILNGALADRFGFEGYGIPFPNPELPSQKRSDYAEGCNLFVLPGYRQELKGMGRLIMAIATMFGAVNHGARYIVGVNKERSLTNSVGKMGASVVPSDHAVWTLVLSDSQKILGEKYWNSSWNMIEKICNRFGGVLDIGLENALRGKGRRERALALLHVNHAKL